MNIPLTIATISVLLNSVRTYHAPGRLKYDASIYSRMFNLWPRTPYRHERQIADQPVRNSLLIEGRQSPHIKSYNVRSFTKKLEDLKSVDHRVTYVEDLLQNGIGVAFYDIRIHNYSNFVFVPEQSAIYVVGNEKTILKLDMNSFFLLDTYTLPDFIPRFPMCNESLSCEEGTKINLLAMMPNDQLVWFCYIHYVNYYQKPPQHLESRCIVPQTGNIHKAMLQWENPHYNSLDPRQSAEIYNSKDGFTYISGYSPDYVRIFRAQMPDWNGQVNWTGALITDKDPKIIAEPAIILLTFETDHQIFFVIREKMETCTSDCKSWEAQNAHRGLNNRKQIARVIRLCKGDRGGPPNVGAGKFGTFAKADLTCQASGDGEGFTYTHLTTAFWDRQTERLFAVFSTGTWAPVGSALCVYDKSNIEAAFNGPVSKPFFVKSGRSWTPIKNPFVNICKRFNSINLTASEYSKGFRISSQYPYRSIPIRPYHGHAVLMRSGIEWKYLQGYILPFLPVHFGQTVKATVLWLGSEHSLSEIILYESVRSNGESITCQLKEYKVGMFDNLADYAGKTNQDFLATLDWMRYQEGMSRGKGSLHRRMYNPVHEQTGDVGSHEEIRQFKVLDSKLFIITDRQLLWFPVAQCSRRMTYDSCMRSKDPHCGWNWSKHVCLNAYDNKSFIGEEWFTKYSPSVIRQHLDETFCPTETASSDYMTKDLPKSWSSWYECAWLDMQKQESVLGSNDQAGQLLGTCLCRLCLRGPTCTVGVQQTTNCTFSSIQNTNWLIWSNWSRCDLGSSMQSRRRTCRIGETCAGISEQQRPCMSGQFRADMKFWRDQVMRANVTSFNSLFNLDYRSLIILILVCFTSITMGCVLSTILFCLWTSIINCRHRPFDCDTVKETVKKCPSNHLKRLVNRSCSDTETMLKNEDQASDVYHLKIPEPELQPKRSCYSPIRHSANLMSNYMRSTTSTNSKDPTTSIDSDLEYANPNELDSRPPSSASNDNNVVQIQNVPVNGSSPAYSSMDTGCV